jgi:hypothetical protein
MHRIGRGTVRCAPLVLAGLLVLAGTGTAHAEGFGLLSGGTSAVPATTTMPIPVPVPAPAAAPAIPPQGYVAYRPVLARLLEPKQYYLGNYAGYQYPSRAPGATLTPTSFRAITSARRRHFFFRNQ